MRLFFAICANEGYFVIKVDATNAYANSPPPDQPTFVYIDEQYADWYAVTYGIDISRDNVLPVQHALQGHPESGSLWERFLNKVLARHGFASTTHERSIYTGVFDGFRMLISRQVDDLAIGCINADSIRKLVAIICSKDKNLDIDEQTAMVRLWTFRVGKCPCTGDGIFDAVTSKHIINPSVGRTYIC
jgi:hypothetical protein